MKSKVTTPIPLQHLATISFDYTRRNLRESYMLLADEPEPMNIGNATAFVFFRRHLNNLEEITSLRHWLHQDYFAATFYSDLGLVTLYKEPTQYSSTYFVDIESTNSFVDFLNNSGGETSLLRHDPFPDAREVACVLVRYTGALEVLLMLVDRGSLSVEQLTDDGVLTEKNLLGVVAELRRLDLVIVIDNTIAPTEKAKKIVKKLRQKGKLRDTDEL